MSQTIEIPAELVHFQLPEAVQERLQFLLDRQDSGEALTLAERKEAEGLVELSEFLSLLRLRSPTSSFDEFRTRETQVQRQSKKKKQQQKESRRQNRGKKKK